MKNMFKLFSVFLILGFFIPYPASAQVTAPDDVRVYVGDTMIATDEVIKVDSASDIDIEIHRPDSSVTIDKYVYEWSNSGNDVGLDENSPNSIQNDFDPAVIDTIDGSFFSDQDSDWDHAWYFHVKAIGIGDQNSVESVFGPYYLDTRAPVTSTIKLKDIPGEQYPDSNQAVSSTVTFEINSTPDLRKVYLSNTQNKPQTVTESIDPSNNEYPYELDPFDTNPSEQKATVYAWFEDEVGNIWNTSIELTITEGKTMEPGGALTLGIDATREFQISGAGDEVYTWTIVDADNTANNSPAATVVGDGNKAVVTGASEGSVKLKAETAGANPIYSGIITVVKLTSTRTYPLIYNGEITSFNLISLPFNVSGLKKMSDLYSKIDNCDGLAYFNATTQAYVFYNPYNINTNLDLVVGEVYYVSINSSSADIVFEGTEQSVKFHLNHNDEITSFNAVSIPFDTNFSDLASVFDSIAECDGLAYFNATTQAYVFYNPYNPDTNIQVNKGDCFYVSVKANLIWP
jgi:hypothetical protein